MAGKIYRRTFEALKYPKGSDKRKELNDNAITSEYQTSKKNCLIDTKLSLSFNRKKDAERFEQNRIVEVEITNIKN